MPMTAVRTYGFLLLLSLAGCAFMPMPREPQAQVTVPQDVSPEMVVLVGRIELHPPLQPGEQWLGTPPGEDMENTFILYCGDRIVDISASGPAGFAGAYSTKLEKDFFIKVGHYPLITVSGGMFYEAYAPSIRVKSHAFKSPLQVRLRPEDQAVYIGTIQYYRDATNHLKSVMIRDDYQWAESQFKQRFGAGMTLRKALVQFHAGTLSER
jgi:hypothetical protein